MFSNISWKEFMVTVFVVLALYYLWLFFIYHSKNIIGAFNNKPRHEKSTTEATVLYDDMQLLQDELSAAIREAASFNYPKEEILSLLQRMIEKCDSSSLAFQYAINNFIAGECNRICSIHLSEAELKQLWVR